MKPISVVKRKTNTLIKEQKVLKVEEVKLLYWEF